MYQQSRFIIGFASLLGKVIEMGWSEHRKHRNQPQHQLRWPADDGAGAVLAGGLLFWLFSAGGSGGCFLKTSAVKAGDETIYSSRGRMSLGLGLERA